MFTTFLYMFVLKLRDLFVLINDVLLIQLIYIKNQNVPI